MTELLSSNTAASGCSSGKTADLRIAVFVDGGNRPAAPHEAQRISFYAKRGGQWAETASKALPLLHMESPDAAAVFLNILGDLIGNAQAVAGASIAGTAYAALNRKGKHIFEIAALTPAQLSGIAEDIAAAEARQTVEADAFRRVSPTQTEIEGVYTLDLVSALEEYPELSSKMILKPFLQNTPFTELTLICRHLPHWLPQAKGLRIMQKQRGDYLVVTVARQHCGEAIG